MRRRIVLKDNVYHIFFSGGDISPAWDYIRYVESSDGGQTWSTPVDKLHATAFNGMDLSACDPSVVYFGGFYYMYYGPAVTNAPNVFQTVVQVARATALEVLTLPTHSAVLGRILRMILR